MLKLEHGCHTSIDQTPAHFICKPQIDLSMSTNRPIHIRLLQKRLLLLSQHLPSSGQRLIHALDAAEPDNRTADPLADPSEGHMAHGPAFFLREFFNAVDDFFVGGGDGGGVVDGRGGLVGEGGVALFDGRASGGVLGREGASEVACRP